MDTIDFEVEPSASQQRVCASDGNAMVVEDLFQESDVHIPASLSNSVSEDYSTSISTDEEIRCELNHGTANQVKEHNRKVWHNEASDYSQNTIGLCNSEETIPVITINNSRKLKALIPEAGTNIEIKSSSKEIYGLGSASIMDETNIHVVEEEAMLTGDTTLSNLKLDSPIKSPECDDGDSKLDKENADDTILPHNEAPVIVDPERLIADAKKVHKLHQNNECAATENDLITPVSSVAHYTSEKQISTSDNPPILTKCASYYKGVCNELNKEKDRLEVNKHHIREDLCQLQLEIKDNVTAVKTLQDTMERLKLAKQKLRTVQHTDTSSRQTTTRQKKDCNSNAQKIESIPPQVLEPADINSKQFTSGAPVTRNDEFANNFTSERQDMSTLEVEIHKGEQYSDTTSKVPPQEVDRKYELYAPEERGANELNEKARCAEVKLSDVIRRAERAEQLLHEAETGAEHVHQLQQTSHKLLRAEMHLMQTNQKVASLEEELTVASAKAEQKCNISEERIKAAEKSISLLKVEIMASKAKLNTISEEKKSEKKKLEMRAVCAEERVLENVKNNKHLKTELIKLSNKALRADRDLTQAMKKIKLVEEDLKLAEEKKIKVENELSFVNETASKKNKEMHDRAIHAEDKLANVKRIVEEAEGKIKVLEQRVSSAEEALCKVKLEAEERVREIKQELDHSEKRKVELETELAMMYETFAQTDKELHKEKNRAERAEKSLLTLKQISKDNEEVLKNSLDRAERESQGAIARALKAEQLLIQALEKTKTKETDLLDTIKRIEDVQKVLNDTENRANRAEKALAISQKSQISCQAELKSKEEELTSTRRQLKETTQHVKDAELKLSTTHTRYKNEISDIQKAAYELNSTLNYEVQEKQDTICKVNLLQSTIGELTSENEELKFNLHKKERWLSEQIKWSKMAEVSNKQMGRMVWEMKRKITALEQRNCRLNNEINLFSKLNLKEDTTEFETWKKIEALKNFLTKHQRRVKHLTREVENFEKDEQLLAINVLDPRNSPTHSKWNLVSDQVYSFGKQHHHTYENTTLEQHCEKIQSMMATFIARLKSAKENILQSGSDASTTHPKHHTHTNKYPKDVHLEQNQSLLHHEKLKGGRRRRTKLSNSEEFSKLQNMKMWLKRNSNVGRIPNPSQHEIEAVTAHFHGRCLGTSEKKRLERMNYYSPRLTEMDSFPFYTGLPHCMTL